MKELHYVRMNFGP